ncbi:MAG TPA: hypothetical protein VK183_02105 [Flavobacterium sp.]|nr:hypothetical protein [Flavobacterium sp.]
MKSTSNKKQSFSIEDFEKGLMLAGYIMPKSTIEFQEREALEHFEALQSAAKKDIYFKRVVLAAEIAYKLHQEPTFGRIKFQKIVYMCEHVAEMDLEGRYLKQAAGPFDNKFMHTIAMDFKKNKWFDVVKEAGSGITRSKYIPLENQDGYKKYYIGYFKKEDERIQFIIELFRKMSTDQTELAATILACHLELRSQDYSWNDLTELFYNWSDKKKRFSEIDIKSSFDWLKANALIS